MIPLKKEFLKVQKEGKFIATPLFNVIFAKNNYGYPRFAIIVGKKNFKLSFTRHKIKRKIATAITSLKLPANDYIFITKKEILKVAGMAVKDEINNLVVN